MSGLTIQDLRITDALDRENARLRELHSMTNDELWEAGLGGGNGVINRAGTVADIEDQALLRRVIKSLVRPVRRSRGVPLWSAVMDHFALGSTYSAQLCRRFEFDPDQMVRKPR